jgi:DNA-binding transcriptional ArsR family regulator
MAQTADRTEILEVTNPRAMRAVAHPARLTILELLHEEGTANATECAKALGSSPQAASYHLRALAKWGFIKPAASDDGRESRWTLVAHTITFEHEPTDSPEFRSAAKLLGRRVLERDERYVAEYLDAEASFEPEWRKAATFSTGTLHLTSEELEELTQEVRQLFLRYERTDPEDRPEGSRRVHVMFRGIPRVERQRQRRRR